VEDDEPYLILPPEKHLFYPTPLDAGPRRDLNDGDIAIASGDRGGSGHRAVELSGRAVERSEPPARSFTATRARCGSCEKGGSN
jgi:hypothetical protein